jgi:hypothetical protein
MTLHGGIDSPSVFSLNTYRIRRKLLKIFGASFHIYDGDEVVGFSRQKAFKLKEDIRVFPDEYSSEEILSVQARQMIDFSAAYDIVDARDGTKVGAARRKGMASLIRDTWEVLDAEDRPIGHLQENGSGMALLRRFITLIPQKFTLQKSGGGSPVRFEQRFNPLIFSLEVSIPEDSGFDHRLLLGVAVLLTAVEGRQK